jgi:adenylate kinase
MSKIPVAICFLGPPASGKGTMAQKIYDTYSYPYVAPGNIFKSMRSEDTELANLVRESCKDGGLCPNWLTNKVVLEESKKLIDSGAEYITLDGFPRTLDQLDFLLENYDIKYFLHSSTHYMTMMRMVINRRNCKVCKNVFSVLNPVCHCETMPDPLEWEKRWDDTPEFFAKRYQVFKKETLPVIEAVKSFENYIKLDLIKNEDSLKIVTDLLKQ